MNKNGKIEADDFMQIAERFIEVGHLTGEAAQEMRDYYNKEIWLKYFKQRDGKDATADSFVSNLKHQGKDVILATTNDIHNRYFADIDTDDDGLIQPGEFIKYFYILGIDEEKAKQAFKALDTNNDGVISHGEFVTAGNDFFTSDEEGKPSDLFFGPLVD
jgi:Ca2+-binding EF-hand superfamily protein